MIFEWSKCIRGAENECPIGVCFREVDIRWVPRGSNIEQNEKKNIYVKFRPLVAPIDSFFLFAWVELNKTKVNLHKNFMLEKSNIYPMNENSRSNKNVRIVQIRMLS